MSDVARLGLAIDSSQATQAATALDNFAAAAKPAAQAATGLERASIGLPPGMSAEERESIASEMARLQRELAELHAPKPVQRNLRLVAARVV